MRFTSECPSCGGDYSLSAVTGLCAGCMKWLASHPSEAAVVPTRKLLEVRRRNLSSDRAPAVIA